MINVLTMKTIIAIIEKGDTDGYSIYASDESIPVVADGLTESEARHDFEENLKQQAIYMKERLGHWPNWYSQDMKVDYRYDMSAFFESFPFINATKFAQSLGINPSLLRKYKSGIVKVGEKQKDLIQKKFDEIVHRLNLVRF